MLQTISVTVLRLVPTLHRASARLRLQGPPDGQGHHRGAVPDAAPLLLLDQPLARPAAYLTAALGVITVAVYISRVRRILPAAAPRTDR